MLIHISLAHPQRAWQSSNGRRFYAADSTVDAGGVVP